MLLEEWIDVWVSMLGDIEPTTRVGGAGWRRSKSPGLAVVVTRWRG
jgi:hypothetical protein